MGKGASEGESRMFSASEGHFLAQGIKLGPGENTLKAIIVHIRAVPGREKVSYFKISW